MTAAVPLDLPAGDDGRPAGDGAAAGAAVASPSATAGEKLVVHVTGSVKNPGVYTLKPGDRINDAVKAAGGFKANAQQDALNLADTIRDADQIFVPAQVSSTPTAAAAGKAKSGGGQAAAFAAEPNYPAPVVRTAASRHPLIVRGTPVRVALAAVHPATMQAQTSPAAVVAAADLSPASSAEVSAAEDAAPPASAAPVRQGRILGRPAAPVEAAQSDAPSGEDGSGGEPQEAAPTGVPAATSYPAASVSKSRGSRAASGSTRRTSGSVSKTTRGSGGASSSKFKNPGDGIVHLNSAGASELEKLPGVGPAMSARILEYRHQIGGFRSVEQILDVKGIGDKKFAKMRPFLAL